jgi:hypothetical protein
MVNPKGRPPKLQPDEKRTIAVNLRLNAAEKARLESLSRTLRCSEGEVLRRGLEALERAQG